MTLQRNIMPPIREIEHIRLQFPEIVSLDNGIPLYILRGKAIQSVKLDFLFTAGQWFQPNKFISSFTNQMMREGTVTFTSSEIAEKLDYYGVFSETVLQRYQSGYSFYILNKHLDNILPLIAEMFMLPLFPENELEIYKKNIHQRLLVNQDKTQSLAAKTSSPEAEENWAQADLQLLTLSITRIYRSVGVVMINLVSTVYHIVTTVTFISKTQVPLTNEYLHRLRILKWLKKRIACPIFQCLWLFISGANENAPQMICGAFQVLSLLVNS